MCWIRAWTRQLRTLSWSEERSGLITQESQKHNRCELFHLDCVNTPYAAPNGLSLYAVGTVRADSEWHLRHSVRVFPGPSWRYCERYTMLMTGQVTVSLISMITHWIFQDWISSQWPEAGMVSTPTPYSLNCFWITFITLSFPLEWQWGYETGVAMGMWDRWAFPAIQCTGWLPADPSHLPTSQLRWMPTRYPAQWNLPEHDRFL